jgi:[protein-PII] uridylyltransferase
MDSFLTDLKTSLSARRKQIADLHASGATGFATCTALTQLMDDTIRSASEGSGSLVGDHAAIFALGGYGRGELAPCSDIDVMILCESGDHREAAAAEAASFLRILWDAGVDVGHAVRTIDEVCALNGQALDAWSGMLESRWIFGNESLAREFADSMRAQIGSTDPHWFVRGVLADLDRRHERYGNSVKLLEPNVKKSAGALRDMHTILWLFRGTDESFFSQEHNGEPVIKGFLRLLTETGFVANSLESEQAMQFILRARHQMHYLRGSLHDTLEYDLQLKVAAALGFTGSNGSSAAEVFMRQYYAHARCIHQLTRGLCRRFREIIEPARNVDSFEPVGDRFLMSGDMLTVSPSVRELTDAKEIFSAFLIAAEEDAEIDFRLQGLIEAGSGRVNAETASDPEVATMFRKILASRNVGYTLRTMNELNVLGRFIPEFGQLVAFFQHNVYHYFTADEHTLIAVGKAEDLRETPGVLHDVFRNVRRKDILYAAILLHDIAKPRSVADHEVMGVDMAAAILTRLGMTDAIPLVSFLVRNHLLMEQVAFRRNIHDPATISEFAARFSSPEQLDFLYLLTYADLSSVNMTVWTDWKASILRDLYVMTSEVLRRNLRGGEIEKLHATRREAAMNHVVDRVSGTIPPEDVRKHLEGIGNEAYISLFSDEEIIRHIRDGGGQEGVSTLFRQAEGHTEITVIGKDAPFVLSHCCAVLSANDADIFDASIFTRNDGVIFDRFRVSDATTHAHLDERTCRKIGDDMRKVLLGELGVATLFDAHKRKWKRRQGKPHNPSTRVDVVFEESPGFTIIDVYAPDTVGFLYRITETISRLGLDIHFAKIATRIDGVVDAFYVRGKDGKPVGPGAQEEIRTALLRTIREVADERLDHETRIIPE